jgi:hypothetical protein
VSNVHCPTCGSPARWIEEYHRWACDKCRSWLDAELPAPGAVRDTAPNPLVTAPNPLVTPVSMQAVAGPVITPASTPLTASQQQQIATGNPNPSPYAGTPITTPATLAQTQATAPSVTPSVAVAVEPGRPLRPAGERPFWVPIAGVATLFAVSLATMLLVMLLTGEFFGGLPKGTGHGRLSTMTTHTDTDEDFHPPAPVDLPTDHGATGENGLSESDCRRMFAHAFSVVHIPADKQQAILTDGLDRCKKEFDRAMYDCAMAATDEDSLDKCATKKKTVEPSDSADEDRKKLQQLKEDEEKKQLEEELKAKEELEKLKQEEHHDDDETPPTPPDNDDGEN